MLLALVVAWSNLAFAKEVDIPELGIHIPSLPVQATNPEVQQRFDGYEATLRVGQAILRAARLEDPVSLNSSVNDAAYRAAQLALLHHRLGPNSHEQATILAGHAAWTGVDASRVGADSPTDYFCYTYVIVDEHLYYLEAYATGEDRRPPDFDATVHAMSAVTFGPIMRSAARYNDAPSGLLKMPTKHVDSKESFYPPAAMLHGEHGAVDFEYSIDGRGRIQDLRETHAESASLRDAARALLRKVTYEIGPDWTERGYEKLRFNLEIQFRLRDANGTCPDGPPARQGISEALVVCASRVR
ncbi:MAG TPA: hypothetical protein VI653_16270 [Steroidobacteraceae bacterium]